MRRFVLDCHRGDVFAIRRPVDTELVRSIALALRFPFVLRPRVAPGISSFLLGEGHALKRFGDLVKGTEIRVTLKRDGSAQTKLTSQGVFS